MIIYLSIISTISLVLLICLCKLLLQIDDRFYLLLELMASFEENAIVNNPNANAKASTKYSDPEIIE